MVLFVTTTYAQQDRVEKIENQLEVLKIDIPGLTKKVELTANGVSLQEFLRGIANTYEINLNVTNDLSIPVINNFANVDVADLLIFLVKQYNLDIVFSGTILSVSKYQAPIEIIPYTPKNIYVEVDTSKTLLSYELRNDTLFKVFKKITNISGKNLVFPPGLENKLLNGYVKDMPAEAAIDKLAYSNNLIVEKTKDDFFLFSANEEVIVSESNNRRNNTRSTNKTTPKRRGKSSFSYTIVNKEEMLIDVEADNAPIDEIIESIGSDLGINIFNFLPLEGNIELSVRGIGFDRMLTKILENTEYTFIKQDSIYYLGEKKQAALRVSERIYMMHRSVEGLSEIIPNEIKKGLEVKEAIGLNSFLISGPGYEVEEFKRFIKKIDQSVPVILIEVMFIVVKNSALVETGIEMGIGEQPTKTSGSMFPNFDMSIGANTINNIIGGFSGFGALNVGNVNPNFYLNLKALENNGNIRIQSTPRLSTLNGHKAVMTVGETTYYIEERNDYVGSQIPQTYQTKNYKPVNAELKLEVKPMVAGDDQITLEIVLEQSDFQGIRIEKGAPPGQNFRQFNSLIRVHNNDVVILGGLEVKSKNDSGSGVPFLSRIPIIKWFFSSRKHEETSDKLSLFIKPTIIR